MLLCFGIDFGVAEHDRPIHRNLGPDHQAQLVGHFQHVLVVRVVGQAHKVGAQIFYPSQQLASVVFAPGAATARGRLLVQTDSAQEHRLAIDEHDGPVVHGAKVDQVAPSRLLVQCEVALIPDGAFVEKQLLLLAVPVARHHEPRCGSKFVFNQLGRVLWLAVGNIPVPVGFIAMVVIAVFVWIDDAGPRPVQAGAGSRVGVLHQRGSDAKLADQQQGEKQFHRVISREWPFSGLTFIPRFNHALAIVCHPDVHDDGFATHLAIFDVLLLLDRSVQQDADDFTAIRANDVGFLDQFDAHGSQFSRKTRFAKIPGVQGAPGMRRSRAVSPV